MMFNLFFSNQVKKFLKNIDNITKQRILNKMELLKQDPIITDSKKLKDRNLFRIRVGNFRVLYEIDYSKKFIGIVKIDKRAKVYN